MRNLTLSAMLCIVVTPAMVRAQDGRAAADSARDVACSYRECALGIVPAWDGLAVVRGSSGPQVANLRFFWPGDVSAALRGDPHALGADSAASGARRAISLRRAGAALTDLGVFASGVALVSGVRAGRLRTEERVVGGAGIAAFLVSLPLQFAADRALSHAVWWHNVRYGR
jgi:hypothetical protein